MLLLLLACARVMVAATHLAFVDYWAASSTAVDINRLMQQ